MATYPNLELIEYKCKESAFELHADTLKDACYVICKVDVFQQTWANTATGFNMDCCLSGQAFTKEYTTVVEMRWHKRTEKAKYEEVKDVIYGVYFGNSIAYMFINPNENFFEDLKNRDMKSQREAIKRYI